MEHIWGTGKDPRRRKAKKKRKEIVQSNTKPKHSNLGNFACPSAHHFLLQIFVSGCVKICRIPISRTPEKTSFSICRALLRVVGAGQRQHLSTQQLKIQIREDQGCCIHLMEANLRKFRGKKHANVCLGGEFIKEVSAAQNQIG